MIDLVGMSEFVSLKSVYQNEKRGEVIALAIADTAMIRKHSQPKVIIETSMEELSTDGEMIKSNIEEYTFRGGILQTGRFARSGNSSILLTAANQFGLNISIPVSLGKRYKVEFWQRSSDQKQTLVVASATKSDDFYKTSFQGGNNSGEWTRSELNVALPENYPEANLYFYLWSPASDSVWVDDFRMMVFE
ncbi:MAG: carbohydrate binding domain-containing protein [Bacteroidota bacterium]|nr:carbohydrate binding domain-containing protein [Bacteroidota bacterium]